jgi:hypothetical protein
MRALWDHLDRPEAWVIFAVPEITRSVKTRP